MTDSIDSIPPESPLVPNRVLQRMYTGIVESRMLEEQLLSRRKKTKGRSAPASYGLEACRVSALIDLRPGDFTSDLPESAATAFLRGVPLQTIVEPDNDENRRTAAAVPLAGLLPRETDATNRLHTAVGVALALKRLQLETVVIVFAELASQKPSAWRDTLQFAAREELPILFIVLPPPLGKAAAKVQKPGKPFALSAQSTANGVPGIPVDAADAVALYRVVQESIGRARAGGGPALMECIRLAMDGKKERSNPALILGRTLVSRKICGQQWLAGVALAFQTRLDAL